MPFTRFVPFARKARDTNLGALMKKLLLPLLLLLAVAVAPGARFVYGAEVPVTPILSAATSTTTGSSFRLQQGMKTFHANVTGTGAVSATLVIEANNDTAASLSWVTLCTITLSGTTSAADACVSNSAYALARARLTAISGTSAAVNVIMGSGL